MRREIRVDKVFVEELKRIKNVDDYKFFYDDENNTIECVCIPKIEIRLVKAEAVVTPFENFHCNPDSIL